MNNLNNKITSDITFITNKDGITLLNRFNILIKGARFFDVLVGYFYTSGFYKLYKSLEQTEKIRILVGIGTERVVLDLVDMAEDRVFSHAEVKEKFEEYVIKEIEDADESLEVENGILKFLEWLKNGKLDIRAYPSKNLHAKLYIITYKEEDRDRGRVITGSSNFTYSGLVDNLEFNVELKNRSDYEFALQKFNELWEDAVDLKDNYIETIQEKTYLNENIPPYHLYLKFLYEYFKDELNISDELFLKYIPESFKRFEYQEQAVFNAKKILEEYGGVFLSDVVGLGKTYMAAMLAGQLDGRTLVIAPPSLLDKNNPGSWPNVFSDFHIPADFESIGKLDAILKRGVGKYANVIVDEAHRFRTDTAERYGKLAMICRGKRVILVTATPYNNTPKDILNQIKLFQNPRKSTIPNLSNLEGFFNRLEKKLKKINKKENYEEYLKTSKENAKEIREKVLKYIMVRRTRSEIIKYFKKDIEKEKIKFPEVQDPIPLYYKLNEEEDKIFNETMQLITQELKYARYTPLLYYKGKITQPVRLSQENMGKIMKVLLVKRFESSFYAFRNSIDRFIKSYTLFLEEFRKGNVYVSKKYINKIFELLERDDDEAVQKLIDEGKAERYDSKDFKENLEKDLKNDLKVLKRIKTLWDKVERDPKLLKLKQELSQNPILKGKKIVIFTESKETAQYLKDELGKKVLLYHGNSSPNIRDKVIENFDAIARNPKDDYMILVSTDVLSEGVNLHRSNIVINYDIPWNPTRMMQRAGRVNRIGTKYDKIYTFNFFPTTQAEDEIQLKKIAESKINAFLTLLGGDAAILTEGEPVSSHELFNRLLSRKTVSGEDELEESELKYLNIIKEVRDKDPTLFERIKHIPKKARSGKKSNDMGDSLLTYFRKGKIQKFFITNRKGETQELDFLDAAKIFECTQNEKKEKLPKDFYDLLKYNKDAFMDATTEELSEIAPKKGRDRGTELLKIIKATLKDTSRFTDEQEEYLRRLAEQLEKGAIPKVITKEALKALNKLGEDKSNPLKVLAALQQNIPERLLQSHYAEHSSMSKGKREVILSLYLKGEGNE